MRTEAEHGVEQTQAMTMPATARACVLTLTARPEMRKIAQHSQAKPQSRQVLPTV